MIRLMMMMPLICLLIRGADTDINFIFCLPLLKNKHRPANIYFTKMMLLYDGDFLIYYIIAANAPIIIIILLLPVAMLLVCTIFTNNII